MRLADYFVGKLPTAEEMEAFEQERTQRLQDHSLRPEHYDRVVGTLYEGLEAFLADADGNPEADPDEVALATNLLTELRESQQKHRDAYARQLQAEQAYEEAKLAAQAAKENLRQELVSLSDEELRAVMKSLQKQYGLGSKAYEKWIDVLRQFMPERVALALDT